MAQQRRHYSYPCWGWEGRCVLYACTACGLAVIDVVVQSLPSMAEGPSDVCPSHFLAQGPSLFCPRHTWLGRIAVCVICALGYAGWAALVIYLRLGTRTQRFYLRLWPSRDATTLLGRGGMECSVYVPRLCTW